MSNNSNKKIVFASILGAILATGLMALNPSPMIINAGAQMYGDQYGYDSNYLSTKSTHTDIQKIKCVNSNINVNGVDITQVPQPNDLAAAESTNEAANGANGNGLGDRINSEKNLVNVCANVNANEQIRITEPQTASLTVNKQVFGCSNIDSATGRMDCQELNDGSASWIPCTNPAISNSIACQNLPANLFDIEVLDNQNTQLQQFEGSALGTTIQNLQPGTYTVNEIKHQSDQNQLGESPSLETDCINDNEFDDGGSVVSTSAQFRYQVCFEYEDEQGNDCSTLTLAAGEDKLCTVKNYIAVSEPLV